MSDNAISKVGIIAKYFTRTIAGTISALVTPEAGAHTSHNSFGTHDGVYRSFWKQYTDSNAQPDITL